MNNNNPLVSVIIPMYNAEDFILETLNSIVMQSYTNWEIIVVNNCSTDSSLKIIEELDNEKVTLITLSKNSGGPAKPRNIGIENAKGEYMAFLDADDIWNKDKLKIQLDLMLKNNYKFTSTNSKFIDKSSNSIDTVKYKILALIKSFNSKKNICDLIKNKFIATSSVMVKKEFISSFDEDQDLVSVEDLYLWLELLNNKNIKYFYIKEKLLSYRVLENSVSSRGNSHKQTTKANMCILKFILHHNRYDIVDCFYSSIGLINRINFLKKILGKNI